MLRVLGCISAHRCVSGLSDFLSKALVCSRGALADERRLLLSTLCFVLAVAAPERLCFGIGAHTPMNFLAGFSPCVGRTVILLLKKMVAC